MKLITAVIRPERIPQVKEALFQSGVSGITLSRVSGHGGEQEVIERYRGTQVMIEFHDKVEVMIGVTDPFVQVTIDAILRGARTGEVGDGKVFVQSLDRVIRIRPGEEDAAALTPITETKLVPDPGD